MAAHQDNPYPHRYQPAYLHGEYLSLRGGSTMKQVINGISYDTESGHYIGRTWAEVWHDEAYTSTFPDLRQDLYRDPEGRFFLHQIWPYDFQGGRETIEPVHELELPDILEQMETPNLGVILRLLPFKGMVPKLRRKALEGFISRLQ